MMKTFDDLWRFIVIRGCVTVQEYNELEHVFNLMQGCGSYLEIGTAEGNSLYVLAHALKPGARITYVDWDETHTRAPREEILMLLRAEGYVIEGIHANTLHREAIEAAARQRYDVVLIDAGHSYDETLADGRNYARLADKYVFFHDVMLPEVDAAFMQILKEFGGGYKFINSETFGYGILEVKK